MFEFVMMVSLIVYQEPFFKIGEVARIEGLNFTNPDDCENELMQMYLQKKEFFDGKRDVKVVLLADPTQLQVMAGSMTTVTTCMSSTEAVVPLR